jgi:hypothetical protein
VTAGTAQQAVASAADGSAKTVISSSMMGLYQQWAAWSSHQHLGGAQPDEDQANPAMLNRLDWYSATGWVKPYPGDTKILAPDQVPGRNLPADYIGG